MVINPEIRGLAAHAPLIGLRRGRRLVAVDVVKTQDDFFAVGKGDRKAVAIGPIRINHPAALEFLQFLPRSDRGQSEQEYCSQTLHTG